MESYQGGRRSAAGRVVEGCKPGRQFGALQSSKLEEQSRHESNLCKVSVPDKLEFADSTAIVQLDMICLEISLYGCELDLIKTIVFGGCWMVMKQLDGINKYTQS